MNEYNKIGKTMISHTHTQTRSPFSCSILMPSHFHSWLEFIKFHFKRFRKGNFWACNAIKNRVRREVAISLSPYTLSIGHHNLYKMYWLCECCFTLYNAFESSDVDVEYRRRRRLRRRCRRHQHAFTIQFLCCSSVFKISVLLSVRACVRVTRVTCACTQTHLHKTFLFYFIFLSFLFHYFCQSFNNVALTSISSTDTATNASTGDDCSFCCCCYWCCMRACLLCFFFRLVAGGIFFFFCVVCLHIVRKRDG